MATCANFYNVKEFLDFEVQRRKACGKLLGLSHYNAKEDKYYFVSFFK